MLLSRMYLYSLYFIICIFFYFPNSLRDKEIYLNESISYFRHGVKDKSYSVKGIEICIKYFQDRGFDVRAVVPLSRYRLPLSKV